MPLIEWQVLGQLFLDRDAGVAHGRVDQPQGVGDGFVYRDRLFFGCSRQAGEILKVGDNLGNPACGHFDVADELQQVLFQKIDGQPAVFSMRCFVHMRFQDRQQIAPHLLEQRRVVDNQIDRVVDLVGDSGNQRAERLHLLCLGEMLANFSVFSSLRGLFQLPGFALFLLQEFLQVLCFIAGFYHHRIKRMKGCRYFLDCRLIERPMADHYVKST